MTEKVDFKKTLKAAYSGKADQPEIVEIPPLQYLMIDGAGDPNAEPYRQAVEALYSIAYPLKIGLKKAEVLDYTVMPLEGLWWMTDMTMDYRDTSQRDHWRWTSMIMQPDAVTQALFEDVRAAAQKKKPDSLAGQVRLETYAPGLSAKILHIGAFADEPPTIDRLHGFIHDSGYTISGKHQEIYFSDPRKSAPEKMRTLIRYPIRLG
jgi:hypothetical protein